MNFRTRWTLPIVCLITLTACQSTATVTRTGPLDVVRVLLPGSVGAGAEMKVNVTVTEGCSETVPDIVAERSASALRLTVQRTVTGNAASTPCLPVVFRVKATYTNPGSPLRTDPFEVFVNGESYGVVAIR